MKRPRHVILIPDGCDVIRLGPKPDRTLKWLLPELSRQGFRSFQGLTPWGMPGPPYGWIGHEFPWPPGALTGMIILVTRDEQSSLELLQTLGAYGAIPWPYAALEVELTSCSALKKELRRLHTFNWVAFTSARAVDVFFSAKRGGELPRLAAVGEATAGRIEDYGQSVDLVAKEFTAAELGKRLTGRILHPTSDPHSPDFAREARKRGATVVEPIVYRIRKPKKAGPPPAYDLVTFASSQTVRNFVEMTKPPRGTLAACIGPVTAETARGLGFKVVAVPKRYTIPDLVKAIVAWRKKSR